MCGKFIQTEITTTTTAERKQLGSKKMAKEETEKEHIFSVFEHTHTYRHERSRESSKPYNRAVLRYIREAL